MSIWKSGMQSALVAKSNRVFTIASFGVAGLGGVVASLFASTAGTRLGLLAAFPVVIAMGLMLVFAWESLFLLIILFRADLDPIFNLTKIGAAGAGVGLGGVLNALVITLAMFAVFRQSRSAWRELRGTWAPFLVAVTVTLVGTPLLIPAIKINLDLLSYAAMYILPIVLVKQKEDHDRWVKCILWSAVGPVAFGLYQIATHHGYVSGNSEVEGFRIDGSFTHPNIFAFYLVFIVSMLFSIYRGGLISLAPSVRRLLPALILIMLVLLMYTKTRSAWGAMAAFFVAYSLIMERKLLPWVILAAVMALSLPEVRQRIAELATGNSHMAYERLNSYAWRKLIWTTSLTFMEPAHYLLGYGRGSFQYYSNIFFPLAGNRSPGAHSVIIQLMFESGVVGVASFAWLLIATARRAVKLLKIDRIEAFMLTMMVVEFAIVSYSDNMLDYLVFNWYLWFMLGLGCSLLWLRRQESEGSDYGQK